MLFLNETKNEEWVKALVYGKSGTGKTTLGCTAPKPVFLLSERQGWDSIRKASRALRMAPPPTFLIQSSKDLNDAVRALNSKDPLETLVKILVWNDEERTAQAEGRKPDKDKAAKTADAMIKALPYTIPETIVPDSITDMFRLESDAIDEISPPRMGKDGLPVKAERYWSSLRERCERLVRRFRDLPFHVLYLALLDDRTVGEDDQKTRSVGPDAPMRALPGAIMQCTNMVGIMSVSQKLVAPTKENREPQAVIKHWVRFTGPDWMMTKPNRPLRDVEVPNFSAWLHTLRTVDPSTVLDLGQGIPTENELAFELGGAPAGNEESGEPAAVSEEAPEPAPEPTPEPTEPEPEQESVPPAPAQEPAPAPKPETPQVSLKKLGESMKAALAKCSTHNELAQVWVDHVDQIEGLRSKAPKAIERLKELTREQADSIIKSATEKFGDDLGVTADDLLERALVEYDGRTKAA